MLLQPQVVLSAMSVQYKSSSSSSLVCIQILSQFCLEYKQHFCSTERVQFVDQFTSTFSVTKSQCSNQNSSTVSVSRYCSQYSYTLQTSLFKPKLITHFSFQVLFLGLRIICWHSNPNSSTVSVSRYCSWLVACLLHQL